MVNVVYDESKQAPPHYIPVKISRHEAAYLYNVLCDNARPWNKRLRTELRNWVTDTESYNAKMRLLGRQS